MQTILGIDIGTTAIKFTLFSTEDYTILDAIKYPVPMNESDAIQSTQVPQVILQLVLKGIKALSERYVIDSLVLSSAMHSLIPVVNGQVGQMYLWSDKRASSIIAQFKENQPELAKRFYRHTGTPIHAMSPFAKLLYFKEEQPAFFASVDQWLDIKAYVMQGLTGQSVVDFSVASATGLFNTLLFEWDHEILTYVSVNQSQLPQAVDTNQAFFITPTMIERLGLPFGTQVYIGASDGTLASYASLIGTGRKISLTVGTSGAVRYLSSERKISDRQITFCYYLAKNQWVIGGATNNGGRTLEWVNELFYDQPFKIFTEIPKALLSSSIGANGLVFLPYINGERAPLWQEDVQGVFAGMTLAHQRQDFIRAICEGILFNLKVIHSDLRLHEKEGIALSGGFFAIPSLAQETAAIFGTECLQSDYTEPAFGAVALIGPSIVAVKQRELTVIAPEPIKADTYQTSFERFKEVLAKERNEFKKAK